MGIRHALGLRPLPHRQALPAVRSLIFVCDGNIIRSPMAAALLEQYLARLDGPQVAISSAGLNAASGNPADAAAQTVSKEFGVTLADHRTRPLTSSLVAGSDVIYVMDLRNASQLLVRFPEAKDKVCLLGSHAHGGHQFEIEDPYGKGDAEIARCYEIIRSCTRLLAQALPGTQKPNIIG